MTSLSAQALIDEWNNGMNLVEILEIMVPQVYNYLYNCSSMEIFIHCSALFSAGFANVSCPLSDVT